MMRKSLDHLTEEQCADLAELAAMVKGAKDVKERMEIRKTMYEIIHPESLGKVRFRKPRRKRRRD